MNVKKKRFQETFAIYLIWIRLKNHHLLRASKPSSHISEVYSNVGVSITSFFFLNAIFGFCAIPGVMGTQLMTDLDKSGTGCVHIFQTPWADFPTESDGK